MTDEDSSQFVAKQLMVQHSFLRCSEFTALTVHSFTEIEGGSHD